MEWLLRDGPVYIALIIIIFLLPLWLSGHIKMIKNKSDQSSFSRTRMNFWIF